MTKKNHGLNPGDVVCLRGQSVALTVIEFAEWTDCDKLLCGWFDKNNVFHKDYFPAQILSKVVLSNN